MMQLDLLIDGMTWGELRAFVAMSTEDDKAKVDIASDEHDAYAPRALVLIDFKPQAGA